MKKFFQPRQLSKFQKLAYIPYFAIGAYLNPERGDFVAGLGDITSSISIKTIKKELINDTKGRILIDQKPIISKETINFQNLQFYGEETLGNKYYKYMSSNGFDPDARSPVKYVMNEDEAYILLRYRQVHDFWHVLTGLPQSLIGEVALKAFEYKVTGFPIGALSVIFGQRLLNANEKYLLYKYYIPWVISCEASCIDLLSFSYEEHLDMNLEQIRSKLKLSSAPTVQ